MEKGGRERGKDGERREIEGGMDGRKDEGGNEGVKEEWRAGGREGRREDEREGRREIWCGGTAMTPMGFD